MVMAGLLMTMASLTANRWLVLGAGAVAGLLLVPLLQRPDVSPLQWQVQTIRRSRAGQPMRVLLAGHNRGQRELAPMKVTIAFAGSLAPAIVRVDAVPPGGYARAEVSLVAGRRGVYRRSVLDALLTDHLGLRHRRYQWVFDQEIVVHPAPAEPVDVLLSAARTDEAVRSSIHGTGELAGLRPWRQGEDQRAVHWRASARRRQLVVAERDVPGLPRRWVVVLAGTPVTDADEALLATVAATWIDQVHQGHEVRVLAWTPDGTLIDEPFSDPASVLDWCARIDGLAVPTSALLLDALPDGTDAVTVIAASTAPYGWVDDVSQAAARQGVRVVPGPGTAAG